MKAFNILRAILALTHLTLVILSFFACLFTIYISVGGNMNYPLILHPEYPINSRQTLLYLLIFFIIFSLGYLYLITLIRNLIISLADGILFTERQVKGFKNIGRWIIIIAISENLFGLITSLIFKELGFGLFFSEFIFYLGTGCFFIVMGEIFAKAKTYKEENELTV